MNLPMTGACRCGELAFRVTKPPMLTSACHCTGCQRMSGSAYSLTVTVPADGFEVTAGAPVIGGLHGADVNHFFCPHCMSWVFTRAPAMPFFVNVRASMLDERAWFTPFVEVYTSEGFPWAKTGAVHSYEKIPSIDEYQRLAAEFSSRA